MAGIYVPIGAVAGHVGAHASWSFLLAAAMTGFQARREGFDVPTFAVIEVIDDAF